MSLFIDDRTVTGVFALGQWFEIVPNSICIDAYEFGYYNANVPFGEEREYEKALNCIVMGEMYKKQEGPVILSKLNASPDIDITFQTPSPSMGFAFQCAETLDTIAFPIIEIKAFRYKQELNTDLYPKGE